MRLAIVLVCSTVSLAADAGQLKALAESHQWFALRDAVRNMAHPPLLYRGAVACAFHDVKRCEQDLQRVAHDGPAADRADAHGLLMALNAVAGRFRLAAMHSEERLKARGTLSAPDGLHAVLAAFGQYPDLTVVSRGPSSVRYERAAGHLLVPASINGGSVRYILDTGANFSMIAESEVKRLGLKTIEVQAKNLGDSTGLGFSLGKVAIADRMDIGNFRLKNVPFMVIGDDLDVVAELPAGARGAIGIQVLSAFGTIRWNSAGTVELGGRAERAGVDRANICYDRLGMLAEGSYWGAKLVLVPDTGDSESHLLPRFAREFAALVKERGKPDTWSLGGGGGVVEVETTILPELMLEVGGLTAAWRPVHILGKSPGPDFSHGAIGLDAFDQATETTIDFQAMRMRLEKR